jgi:hypothetical protein
MTRLVLHTFVVCGLLQGPIAGSPQPAPGHWPDSNSPLIDCARGWCTHGYRPIPLDPRDKKTIVKTWPHVRFEQNLPLYFDRPYANRKLSIACGGPSGHVDIDLDCGEVAALWHECFGPPTGLMWGRTGKPSSRWFYYADAIISNKYQCLPSVNPQTGKNLKMTASPAEHGATVHSSVRREGPIRTCRVFTLIGGLWGQTFRKE